MKNFHRPMNLMRRVMHGTTRVRNQAESWEQFEQKFQAPRHHWFRATAAAVCACLLAGAPMNVPAAFATDDSPASDGSSTSSDISSSGSAHASSALPTIADDLPTASVSQVDDPQCLPRGTSPSSSSYEQAIRLLFSPDGSTAYTVPFPAGDAVCRVDVASMTVTGKADLAGVTLEPTGTAEISDDGSHILLAVDDNGQGGMGLSIATADMSVTRLPVSSWWFVPSPDGSTAYAYTNSDPSSPQTRRIVSLSTADGTITDEKTINLPFASAGIGAEIVDGISTDRLTWYIEVLPEGSSAVKLLAINAQSGTATVLPIAPTHDDASEAGEDYFRWQSPRRNGFGRGNYAPVTSSSDAIYYINATLDGESAPTPLVVLDLRTGALSAVDAVADMSKTLWALPSADGSVLEYSANDGSADDSTTSWRIVSTSDWSVKGTLPVSSPAQYKGEKVVNMGSALSWDGSTSLDAMCVDVSDTSRANGVTEGCSAPVVLRLASTDGAYAADYAVEIPNAEAAVKNVDGEAPYVMDTPTPDETGMFLVGGGLPLTKVTVPADWKQQAAAASQAASDAAAAEEADDAKDAAPDASRGRRVAWGVGVAVAVVVVLVGVAVASRRRGGKRRH